MVNTNMRLIAIINNPPTKVGIPNSEDNPPNMAVVIAKLLKAVLSVCQALEIRALRTPKSPNSDPFAQN